MTSSQPHLPWTALPWVQYKETLQYAKSAPPRLQIDVLHKLTLIGLQLTFLNESIVLRYAAADYSSPADLVADDSDV